MTSKIKVDNINKVSDDSNIIKKCGTTTTIGSGASNPIVVDGSAVTLGRCGGTVALASGATQTGFGRTGTVDWNTTPKTATFTAVSGDGFFANTSGGAFNMNLPAGVAGAIVSVADYAETWQTNALTVVPNGTDKIGSLNQNATLSTQGQSVTFVFVDSTQGWINTMDSTSNVRGAPPFIVATGGTITTSGNDKIHTFTGPGTFTVCSVATSAANNQVSYLVVAGGGAGGNGGCGDNGAGGGAGGFREDKSPTTPYTASPLEGAGPITVTATAFPIVVGSGGAVTPKQGGAGNVSTFSTITSAGGGGGGANATAPGFNSPANGQGGSGGGGRGGGSSSPAPLLVGNTPTTSPAQGNPGGLGGGGIQSPDHGAGGGGGAGQAGQNSGNVVGGVGGNGSPTNISGSDVTRAGGGGGGAGPSMNAGGAGGSGGGGTGAKAGATTVAGTANTGGGGGGGNPGATPLQSAAGGSGIVIIRYKFQ